MRTVHVRTGVVLDGSGGALGRCCRPSGSASGAPWQAGASTSPGSTPSDLVGIILASIDDERWSGPVNATAPDPSTNRDFSRVLGKRAAQARDLSGAGLAINALYGDMAEIVTSGARVMPAKALVLGYTFAEPALERALRSAHRR